MTEQFDIEAIFKNGHIERSNFLSRVFGIFNEEIVRIWCRDSRSPFNDVGRPTIYGSDSNQWSTLDFTLAPVDGGQPLIAEMKCEIAFENFKYLRLENANQLDHHRGKVAFERFMEIAADPHAYSVRVKREPIEIGGAALVWGAVGQSNRAQIMQDTGLAQILSLEDMLEDLHQWDSSELEEFVATRQSWLNDLMDAIGGNGSERAVSLERSSGSRYMASIASETTSVSGDSQYSAEYSLEYAIESLKNHLTLEVPLDLFNAFDDRIFRLDEDYLYFANEFARKSAEKYMLGRDWNDFVADSTAGYLSFGYFGHGVNSWGYIMDSNSPGSVLSLRLPCGGGYRSDDSFLKVNRYLLDLSELLTRLADMELEFEAVENMGYGRYRIFDKNGNGVEREVSVLDNPERIQIWNRLIAELGVMDAKIDANVVQYIAPDEAFGEWQVKNPMGSVMVLGSASFSERPLIHSSGCPFMGNELQLRDHVVCAAEVRYLEDWADKRSFRTPGLCTRCFFFNSGATRVLIDAE